MATVMTVRGSGRTHHDLAMESRAYRRVFVFALSPLRYPCAYEKHSAGSIATGQGGWDSKMCKVVMFRNHFHLSRRFGSCLVVVYLGQKHCRSGPGIFALPLTRREERQRSSDLTRANVPVSTLDPQTPSGPQSIPWKLTAGLHGWTLPRPTKPRRRTLGSAACH